MLSFMMLPTNHRLQLSGNKLCQDLMQTKEVLSIIESVKSIISNYGIQCHFKEEDSISKEKENDWKKNCCKYY